MISRRAVSGKPDPERPAAGRAGRRLQPRTPAFVVAIAIAVWLPGCASTRSLFPSHSLEPLPWDSPVLPRTLDPPDAWLRHYLLLGEPAAALTFLDEGAGPRIPDPLLHDLQAAIAARSSGELELSNTLFEQADLELERRKVLSVSETAGSYLVSDRLRSYLPASGEAALIPFYRLMNYMAIGDAQAAAVEARRISAIVEGVSDEGPGGCRQAAMLNYAAAFAFEGAGELNDALVSLRRAEATMGTCEATDMDLLHVLSSDIARVATALGFDDLAAAPPDLYVSVSAGEQSSSRRLSHHPTDASGSRLLTPADVENPAAKGEVVVLIEQGFIAHRAEGTLHIPLFEDEIDDLDSDDAGKIAEVAALVAARIINNFAEKRYYGRSWDDQPFVQVGQSLSGAHIVRLVWPELHDDGAEPTRLRVLSSADTVHATLFADLSEGAGSALAAERAASLTRLVSRSLTKFLASRAIENRAEKEGGELLGFVAGRLSNLAANATERADTRSWSLLPDRISLARFTLPAGEQQLAIQSQDPETGTWSAIDLGSVSVEPGRVVVISRRIWNDAPSAPTDDAVGAHPGESGWQESGSLRDSTAASSSEEIEDEDGRKPDAPAADEACPCPNPEPTALTGAR